MDAQDRVAAFVDRHGLEAPPAYRALDLAAETGEVAKEVADSTGYGTDPEAVDVDRDEVGDALFSLLALADELGIDADAALAASLDKYRRRIETDGSPGSGA